MNSTLGSVVPLAMFLPLSVSNCINVGSVYGDKKVFKHSIFPFLVCGCINMGSVLGNRRPAGDGNQSLDGFSTDFDQNMKRPIFGEKIFDHPRRNWLRSVCLLFGDDRCSPPAAYYLVLIREQRLKTNTFLFVSPQPFIKVDLIQGQPYMNFEVYSELSEDRH